MSVEWPFTNLGIKFFEGTVPRIAKALERIADSLAKLADAEAKPKWREGEPPDEHEDVLVWALLEPTVASRDGGGWDIDLDGNGREVMPWFEGWLWLPIYPPEEGD